MPLTHARAPVRVGVALAATHAPSWAAWVLEAVRTHPDLELALVLRVTPAPRPRKAVLLELYETLDRRRFASHPDALDPVDVSGTLAGVPVARVDLGSRADGGRPLRDDDVAVVRGLALDVVLDFEGAALGADVSAAVRHGVWSWHVGDPVRYRGEPPLFWEMHERERAATSVLEIAPDGDRPGTVLYASATSTDPLSLQRTRNPVYWKSARFALRRLEDLAAGRWTPDASPSTLRSAPAKAPSNADVTRHVSRLVRRNIPRKMRNVVSRSQWFLGFRQRRATTLPFEDGSPWRVALPPPDRYWADPFVVDDARETLVFLEEVRYERGKGELVVGRLGDDGTLSDVEPVLTAPHHLSYPYVFRDAGRAFMVPESGEAGRVDLWTATEFPRRWERVATLVEGLGPVDASILRHGGLYWMWVNDAVPGGRADDECRLYFSDRLDSGWTPHPLNPVVSDAMRARSGGRPFVHDGTLIRPAQDCTGRYGARIVFNAVDVLTPDDYREHVVGSLTPSWAPAPNLCAHTYTFGSRWEATDGLHRIPRGAWVPRIGARPRARDRATDSPAPRAQDA